ncbi:MAG: sigma 54-interacting transcriptional regulator [Candidatus Krumholzibacteriales bacterium]
MSAVNDIIIKARELLNREEYKKALIILEDALPEGSECEEESISVYYNREIALLLARAYYHNQLYEEAAVVIKKLEQRERNITGEKDFIFLKYQILLIRDNPQKAIDFLSSLAGESFDDEIDLFIRYCLGKAYFWKGNYHSANICFRKCREYYDSRSDNLMLGNVLYMLGYTAFQRSFFEVAESYYRTAARNFQLAEDKNQEAATDHMLGILYYKTGRYKLAEIKLSSAARYYEISGNRTRTAESLLARGRVCIYTGELDRGRRLVEEGTRIADKIDHRRAFALGHEFLGEINLLEDNLDEALYHFKKAESLALEIAPAGDIALEVSRRLGDLYIRLDQFPSADEMLSKALKLAEKLHDNYELGAVFRAMGVLQLKTGQLESAMASFRESVSVLRLIKEKFELARTLFTAAESLHNYTLESELSDEKTAQLNSEIKDYANNALKIFRDIGLRKRTAQCKKLMEKISENPVRKKPESGFINISIGEESLYRDFMVAQSEHLKKIIDKCLKISPSEIPVLITGETGTGKEIIARFIHASGNRSEKSFIPVNCASITDQVFESELFGHSRGAFTGAVRNHIGLFERASGGTLFLDEISELSVRQQAKLLRALQEKRIRRVGESREREVDFRVISASNQDLDNLLRTGALRKDFYYRINNESVRVKPLRKHREDINPLLAYYLKKFGAPLRIGNDALELLNSYNWPGNIRQLVNLARLLSVSTSDPAVISMGDLPPGIRKHSISGNEMNASPEMNPLKVHPMPAIGLTRDPDDIRRLVVSALVKTGGNKSAAARELGISRSTIYRLIKRLDIT